MQTVSLFIYNISIRLYWLAIFLASFFNTKAKQWIDGRKNWRENLRAFQPDSGKRIWFHCASLGEFEQARPVIEKLRSQRVNDKIIVTFFSPSGYEIRKDYHAADLILYLPLDTASNAKEFIGLLKPDIALFVKYEFWFHYLKGLKQAGIPSILFSSVFRENQAFFKWYGTLFREMLTCFHNIFVQNDASKQLLQKIGVSSEVAFDTRFDRVREISLYRKPFPVIEKFKGSSRILIAGSTWGKDEELIVQCVNEDVLKKYKYIIAPHNINQQQIDGLIRNISVKARRFSEMDEANAADTDVLIIDSIGQLAYLYVYGEIAYVGGGFDASVHNVLEPAIYGMPVLFGPNFQKSEEAKALHYAAISDFATLKKVLEKLDNSEGERVYAGSRAQQYIAKHLGGSKKVIEAVIALLD